MHTLIKTTGAALFLVFLVSCGGAGKDEKSALNDKKATLEKLKADQRGMAAEISKLEEEIKKLDPSAAREEKAKLVALTTLTNGDFTHYIDLQGMVESENIAYVTPRGMGGQVRAIYVKQGQSVKKGQLLLKLDDALERKQIDQVESQLVFAEDLYKRQQNLWSQNIGTEVQLLSAKNNVDQLKKQLALAQEQLSYTNVYAEMSGVADQVNIKVGETFSATSAAMAGIRIVNSNNLKAVVKVPENYLGRVGVGSVMEVVLPESNKTINARINVAGKVIDPLSRSFYVEAPIPGNNFRPNQIALVRIQDYYTKNTITIPVNTLQTDEQGKFVLVAVKEGNRLTARKKRVEIGEIYGDKLEVKSGLAEGDQLIVEGFQGLYDGLPLTTSAK